MEVIKILNTNILMKITKNELKELIREELKSFKKEINETQSINEGLWTGIKTRGSVTGINGKKGVWSVYGSGTSFQQILWQISPKKGFLDARALDDDGKPEMTRYWTGWPGPGEAGLLRFFQHNEWEGLDIEKDFPYEDVNKMRKAYDKLPVKTQVKMAHGDHKLAMRFLAKYGIKP